MSEELFDIPIIVDGNIAPDMMYLLKPDTFWLERSKRTWELTRDDDAMFKARIMYSFTTPAFRGIVTGEVPLFDWLQYEFDNIMITFVGIIWFIILGAMR